MDPMTLSATTLAGLAVVLALTELLKPYVPVKFWPLLALGLAIGWTELVGYIMGTPGGPLFLLAQGILLGLTATGAYAAGKHVITTNTDGSAVVPDAWAAPAPAPAPAPTPTKAPASK